MCESITKALHEIRLLLRCSLEHFAQIRHTVKVCNSKVAPASAVRGAERHAWKVERRHRWSCRCLKIKAGKFPLGLESVENIVHVNSSANKHSV